ncbi:MAG: thrombospondin type 3 repeat-containing protein [Parcubacteria group bacterium]
MFDNQQPNQNPVPRPTQNPAPTPRPITSPNVNQPKPIEDMFAGVDKGEKIITAPRPMMAMPPSPSANAPLLTAEPVHKRHFFLLGAIIIVVLLIVAGGIVYARWLSQQVPTVTPTSDTQTTTPVVTDNQTAATVDNGTTAQDSDSDGLSDTEEAALGTNPYKTDSDDDGLSDYDEAKVYHTNPINPDTDVDTYLDGEEVSKGYNPNGAGKLLNTQAEIEKLQNNGTQ